MKKITLIAFMAFLATALFAQKDSLNAVVKVENEYNPIIVKAIKPSFTPQVEAASVSAPLDLVFSRSATPFERYLSSRDVTALLPAQPVAYNGFARLGYGNNGWLDTKLGYRFDFGANDKLNLFASLTGYKCDIDALSSGEWESRFYNTWLMADYTHTFRALTLNVAGSVNNNVFNYQPALFTTIGGIDKQNSSAYNLMASIKSNLASAISYRANVGYSLNGRKYSSAKQERVSENHFVAGGEFAYEIDNKNLRNLGVAADFDAFVYNDAMKPRFNEYDNYMSIRFNPFMNFRFDQWKLRAGVHADLLTANGKTAAFAPDITLDGAVTDFMALYANITGGNSFNGFERLGELSPYWCYRTDVEQFTPTYKVFDANTGVRLAFEPVSVNLYVGYDYEKYSLLPTIKPFAPTGFVFTDFLQDDTRKFYIGGEAGCDWGGMLDVKADVRYNRWSTDAGEGALLFTPALQANMKARVRLYEGLYFGAGYNYARYTKDGGERITDMNNLTADISYKFHKQFSVYLQGYNLLNKDFYNYAGYITRGASVQLGVECNF